MYVLLAQVGCHGHAIQDKRHEIVNNTIVNSFNGKTRFIFESSSILLSAGQQKYIYIYYIILHKGLRNLLRMNCSPKKKNH